MRPASIRADAGRGALLSHAAMVAKFGGVSADNVVRGLTDLIESAEYRAVATPRTDGYT